MTNPILEAEKALHIEDVDRAFLLKVVQPSLVGLIDGSISTLAPLFAAAFASHDPHITFLVGSAAAIGAAISMAFAEGLSDTGEHTGRGHPAIRGSIVGVATFIGGIFHTLPFLVPDLNTALTLAYIVVAVELIAISYIRYHYFKLSFWSSIAQVLFGGVLVFLAGILIGSA
ncbi:VIT family protein [Candidatus Kaiserbacteria bacterium RIFCSPHIGHO2_02_FULL_55_25]|uniref:VIT family protein n=1 Tax=Candidatus Kaiserbacteria bacterium RIFCSPHIGHO2_02_FULL_55_25 TaxID=1798498 RepID=A0A1F6E5K2_9BACT|nr:MAG: VIT family protein [Candidatus Kaiserbacteria bacterium RIFCSPHIGHO2_02_FULL_55_25]OGG78238.1 MAG: VIT family protein [Candidatus Kaiserbacteria bacterium RIFCSPHIGHO2_12_FULL_55_13]OGG84148.1 MAG: VIT family protein [Candidatus Kaiserbacteria bacterium RIFCSPLOWO2_01_FULL_55_25]